MSNLDSISPTQDERVMAGLSHISALLPLMGVIAPIVIWVTQKDKSRFVAFQSLQALAYQLVMILAWFVGMGCYMASFFSTFFFITFMSSDSAGPGNLLFGLGFLTPFLVFGLIFLGGFLFIIYGIVGAVLAFQGRDFRYFILGRQVERFLRPAQPPVEAEKS